MSVEREIKNWLTPTEAIEGFVQEHGLGTTKILVVTTDRAIWFRQSTIEISGKVRLDVGRMQWRDIETRISALIQKLI